jgi:hypothetical protein
MRANGYVRREMIMRPAIQLSEEERPHIKWRALKEMNDKDSELPFSAQIAYSSKRLK